MGRTRVWREEEAVGLVAEVRALRLAGGIVALPTETFYALAVYPFERKALGRLFTLKARSPEKPVLVLVAAPEMLAQVAAAVPPPGGFPGLPGDGHQRQPLRQASLTGRPGGGQRIRPRGGPDSGCRALPRGPALHHRGCERRTAPPSAGRRGAMGPAHRSGSGNC